MTASIPRKPNYKKNFKSPENDPYVRITAFVPKSIARLLKIASDNKMMPMSKLMVFAIDHEFNKGLEAFDQKLEKELPPFVANEYATEASQLYDFLKVNMPNGAGLDALWLFRREIGILDKTFFLLAYRELIESGMVEEFHPRDTKFQYDRSYKAIRIKKLRKELTSEQY